MIAHVIQLGPYLEQVLGANGNVFERLIKWNVDLVIAANANRRVLATNVIVELDVEKAILAK